MLASHTELQLVNVTPHSLEGLDFGDCQSQKRHRLTLAGSAVCFLNSGTDYKALRDFLQDDLRVLKGGTHQIGECRLFFHRHYSNKRRWFYGL